MDDRQKLNAITIYCEGVKADYPETSVWMDNIIKLVNAPNTNICTVCKRNMNHPGFDGCMNGDRCPHGFEPCF